MSNFTAADVKKLRDLTGAGMMDCKKALTESDGDHDRAVELLRIKGAKDVGKRAGRTTANGLVANSGPALLELNCETDFVAKNTDFVALGQRLVEHVVATRPADVEELLASTLDGITVGELISAEAARIGEKLVVNRFEVLDQADGSIAIYLHRKSPDLPPQLGVAVAYSGATTEQAASTAQSIAMQIAAMRPRYVSRDEIPEEVIESERRIAEQTAIEEGKPAAVIPRITEGRVKAFLADVVLGEQNYVDPKASEGKARSVQQVLGEVGITVSRFVRFEVGQA